MAMVVALLATAASSLAEPAGPDARSPAASFQAPDAGADDAAHSGHTLCIHRNVPPVSVFYHHYTDPMGSHYHGWLPPAGPPFYVQCFDAAAAYRGN
jgi:hypothetical protein